MEITNNERKMLQFVIEQSAARDVEAVEYLEAVIAAALEGRRKYPNDEQKIHEYADSILNEKYPVVQKGGAV